MRFAAQNIQQRAGSDRVNANVWDWIWAFGPGELVEIDGLLNGEQYLNILEDVWFVSNSSCYDRASTCSI